MRKVLLFVVLLLSCSGDLQPAIKVNVSQVPDGATLLEVMASLDGQPVLLDGKPTMQHSLVGQVMDGQVSLGLLLPVGSQGQLVVSVNVRDVMGCITAFGVGDLGVDMLSLARLNVPLSLLNAPSPKCIQSLPAIDSISTADMVSPPAVPTSGGQRTLTLHGWGFQQGATVTVAGMPPVDPGQVRLMPDGTIRVEAREAPGKLGQQPVVLRNPDGRTAQSSVRYKATQIMFISKPQSVADLSAYVPAFVLVQDINGDSFPDLITANAGKNSITVLMNDGHGNFLNAKPYGNTTAVAANQSATLAAGDLFHDGHVAVLAPWGDISAKTLSIFFNDKGDGMLRQNQYDFGIVLNAAALGDLNHTGRQDLVESLGTTPWISVFPNTGVSSQPFMSNPMENPDHGDVNPGPPALADMNNDNSLDLLVCGGSALEVSLNQNKPETGIVFASPPWITTQVGSGGCQVAIGDVNHDGYLDLAVAAPAAPSQMVPILINRKKDANGQWLGLHDGTQGDNLINVNIGANTLQVILLDVDGDDWPDMIGVTADKNGVFIIPNLRDPQGAFAVGRRLTTGVNLLPNNVGSIATGDLDGDGRMDIVVANSKGLTLLMNTSQ